MCTRVLRTRASVCMYVRALGVRYAAVGSICESFYHRGGLTAPPYIHLYNRPLLTTTTHTAAYTPQQQQQPVGVYSFWTPLISQINDLGVAAAILHHHRHAVPLVVSLYAFTHTHTQDREKRVYSDLYTHMYIYLCNNRADTVDRLISAAAAERITSSSCVQNAFRREFT